MYVVFFKDQLQDHAIIIAPNEGEQLNTNGIAITFKVTSEMSNNQLGIYQIVLPPKTIGANLHYHRFMDDLLSMKGF